MSGLDQTEFWRGHVRQRAEKGMSRSAYCRENELVTHRMHYWERKFLGVACIKKERVTKKSAFVPVVVKSKSPNEELALLRLSNGIEIVLYFVPEANWILELNGAELDRDTA